MTDSAAAILTELQALGSDSYRRILLYHGVRDPCYGVKIEYLKVIQKRVKTNYQLALDLYASQVYDAMYLDRFIADETRMTPADLNLWPLTPTANSSPPPSPPPLPTDGP